MVAPLGGGLATGANGTTYTAPGQAGTVTAGAATLPGQTGAITAPGGIYNATNPDYAIRAYLRSKGLDPDVHSKFGDWIQKLMGVIVPSVFQTHGMGGVNPDGSIKRGLDDLGGDGANAVLDTLFAQGGLGANLSNYASGVRQGIAGNAGRRNLPDPMMERLLGDLNNLGAVGQNPYLAAASQDQLSQQFGARDDNAGQMANGLIPQQFTSLWDFIQNLGR